MKNKHSLGDRFTQTLAAAVTSGDPRVIGTGLLGIAVVSGVVGDAVDFDTEGVFYLPKNPAAAITKGQQVLWDVSEGNVDDDQAVAAAGDFLCGYAWESAGSGATTVPVKINRPAPTVA